MKNDPEYRAHIFKLLMTSERLGLMPMPLIHGGVCLWYGEFDRIMQSREYALY